MIRPKIYLDTSVINFLCHDDTPEKKDATHDFFDNYVKTGVYQTFISVFVTQEISKLKTSKSELICSI
jgi:hypothetical protein